MTHLYNKFDKHAINELPKVLFPGRIIVIQSEREAEKAVDYLLNQYILGFDTETRPSFAKGGRVNKVALLQVSTHDICFLFRLDHIDMPDCIIRLLSDTEVLKIGLSWHDDINVLHRRAEFEPGTFVELQEYVKCLGIEDLSLQKLYANIFHEKISKSQRLTNWEAETYTDAQKLYAATDAWACIQLYEEITRLAATKDYELEVIPEPEPPQLTPEEIAERAARKAAKEAERRRRKKAAAKRRKAEIRARANAIAAERVEKGLAPESADAVAKSKKPKRKYYPKKKKTVTPTDNVQGTIS